MYKINISSHLYNTNSITNSHKGIIKVTKNLLKVQRIKYFNYFLGRLGRLKVPSSKKLTTLLKTFMKLFSIVEIIQLIKIFRQTDRQTHIMFFFIFEFSFLILSLCLHFDRKNVVQTRS